MRTLLKVTLDVVASNQAILDGNLARIIGDTTSRVHPEPTYFYTFDGCRSCINNYTNGIKKLNFKNCPRDLKKAFNAHKKHG